MNEEQIELIPLNEEFGRKVGSIMNTYDSLPQKLRESRYVDLTTENVLDFAEFMQTREARRFVRKYGFPKELSFIYVNDLYNSEDNSEKGLNLKYKIIKRKLDSHVSVSDRTKRCFDYDDFQGNYLETDKRNVIELNYPIPGSFLIYFMRIMPRRDLSMDVNIITADNFDELNRQFPVFNDKGECKYVADINNGKVIIPDVKTIAYMEKNFGDYFIDKAKKQSA